MAKAAAAEPQTQLEKYLRAAAPFLTQAGHFANAVYPHLEAAVKAGYAAYLKVAPYQNDFGPLLLGAILLFCGWWWGGADADVMGLCSHVSCMGSSINVGSHDRDHAKHDTYGTACCVLQVAACRSPSLQWRRSACVDGGRSDAAR